MTMPIPTSDSQQPENCNILGVKVEALGLTAAAALVSRALEAGRRGYICFSGVHGIIEAQRDPALRNILNSTLFNFADGMPLVWIQQLKKHPSAGRVYGPDFMIELTGLSVAKGWTHFLYGGKPGVAEELKRRLEERFSGIKIVGTFSPPFRPMNETEAAELMALVKQQKPDLFWVGISTPKQEAFMAEFLPRLDTRLMFGVGAAFDIHSGRRADAPDWMKRTGLQWFHRLCQEPRRLWRRYAFIVPAFLFLSILQLVGLKKYHLPATKQQP